MKIGNKNKIEIEITELKKLGSSVKETFYMIR